MRTERELLQKALLEKALLDAVSLYHVGTALSAHELLAPPRHQLDALLEPKTAHVAPALCQRGGQTEQPGIAGRGAACSEDERPLVVNEHTVFSVTLLETE